MPFQESQGFCRDCDREVLIRREVANHLLYALITFFLCGLWLPIWIIAGLSSSSWRCSRCGGAVGGLGDVKAEALAGGRIKLAKQMIAEGNFRLAQTKLEQVIKERPDTDAAKEAKVLLDKIK